MARTKVGIPRALLYYEYGDFFCTFLKRLGAELVISSHTNPDTVEQGVKLAVDEACLPVKVLCGHVEALAPYVDWVFLPRIVSVRKREYTCPKMLGVPEMLLQQLEAHPARILSADVDLYNSHRGLFEPCAEIAKKLGKTRLQSLVALLAGLVAHHKQDARRRLAGFSKSPESRDKNLRIGILGHRYLIMDDGVNLGLARHLGSMGVTCVVAEDEVPQNIVEREARTLPKPLFWSYEKNVLGAAFHLIRHRLVDGLVQMVSFGCGPDSMVASLIEAKARECNVPYLLLSVDEHSGEAGTVTRLEAFVDMLSWRAGL